LVQIFLLNDIYPPSILPTTASINFSLSACERMSPAWSLSQRDMSWSTMATMRRYFSPL